MIHGLYGIADATAADGDPERIAAAFLEGGCRLLQLRCKGWATSDIERVARQVGLRCRAAGATFIVNDHVQVAAAVGAHGVHLGQLDIPTASARKQLGPDAIIGRSTHDLAQLAEASRQATYVAFGPVWSTPNGGRDKGVRGVEALCAARAAVPGIPLVAIGGVTRERLALVRAAGVDAWAVIGEVAGADDPVAVVRGLCA